ncbi:MAG: NAD(P)/FAD-dependent oxidoreductase [Ferruginibacter sp.]
MEKKISIIGAGLVGSLLSIYLAKRGYKISVFERRADMRLADTVAGRSINLALSDRGIKALEEVGIMEEIRKIAIPMHGREMHSTDGNTTYQPYGQKGQFINSVSRAQLNMKLMDLAEEKGVAIFFEKKLQHINWQKNELVFEDGQSEISDIIFGSDGAYSAARLTHQLQSDRFQYDQFYIDFGYKELNIPADKNGSFLLKENALHIWPRKNYMLIALPNTDGSFTCTLFFPFEGNPSFESLDTKEKVREFFNETFSDVSAFMPNLEKDFFDNPTGSLVTIKCYPWIRKDQFSLIGDAAHAIVPFFGQGMNCGFEDCSVLNSLIDKYAENWEHILKEFQQLRKPDADAIAELALNNFVEMRDKVADKQFLLQKKIEAEFSSKHPDKWTPAYGMVTFSPHIRYSEAKEIGSKQQSIMDKIMNIPGIEEKWQEEEVEMMILTELQKQ